MLAKCLQEAQGLPAVAPEAVQAYKAHLDGMVEWVNQAMAAHPEVHRLIGFNPLSMMYDNHLNHARFMASVFRFRAMALLVKTVVWVYRTYHSHGFSYDYFPAELAAWQQALTSFLEPSQSQAIVAIYQWLVDHHEVMVALAEEPVAAEPVGHPAWQAQREAFLQALLQGDSQTCLNIGSKITKTSTGLQSFYLEIIQPCMYEVGRLWERGEISVAQEHLASAQVARLMAVLFPNLELVPQPKGRAVVTATVNEFHETGARCVADLLALDGWQIAYLGANTPTADLISYLLQTHPQVLAISVAMPFNLDFAADTVTAIRLQPELAGLKVMVGGLAFSLVPELWQITGADGYAPQASDAVTLARSWWRQA